MIRRQFLLFVVALQYLTRLPLPSLAGFESSWLSASARYFPLVGLLVGAINAAAYGLAVQVFPPAVAVGLMLAVSLLTTGAFHEDGFADTCDGLGGGYSREQVLAIMRDSRIGAYGAIGLIVLFGIKWTALAGLSAGQLPFVVVIAHTLSRWAALALIWRLSYVRMDESTKARPLASSVDGSGWVIAGAIVLPLLIAIAGGTGAFKSNLVELADGLVAAAVTTLLMGLYLRRHLGGYTGDTLGATQQLSEVAVVLVVLASRHP